MLYLKASNQNSLEDNIGCRMSSRKLVGFVLSPCSPSKLSLSAWETWNPLSLWKDRKQKSTKSGNSLKNDYHISIALLLTRPRYVQRNRKKKNVWITVNFKMKVPQYLGEFFTNGMVTRSRNSSVSPERKNNHRHPTAEHKDWWINDMILNEI